MIHIYYGYGKGKTTSAIGAGMRAYGADLDVLLVQFLKNSKSSELNSVPFVTYPSPGDLSFNPTYEEYSPWVNGAITYIKASTADVIILDEFLDIIDDFMSLQDALELLQDNTKEFIITGHIPVEALLQKADYVTHFEKKKHPYDVGITARKGIEF